MLRRHFDYVILTIHVVQRHLLNDKKISTKNLTKKEKKIYNSKINYMSFQLINK